MSTTSSSTDSQRQMTLEISTMSCGGCVSAVRKALSAVPGARVDEVTVGSATVSYDAAQTTPEAIAQAVRDAGYEPVAAGEPVLAGEAAVSVGGKAGSCCS